MKRTVKKPAERRAEIIEAARNLFQTKDYEKTTMQDVMAYLGIAKGTIYHYFTSKEALLEAVVEHVIDTSVGRMKERIGKTKGDALKKMRVLIETGNIAQENAGVLESLHKPGNEAMHTRLLAVAIRKQAPLYAEVIQQGYDEGVFHTQCPLESAEYMLTAVQFLTDRGIYPWTHNDIERRVAAFPKLIEQQLGAPEGSFRFLGELFNL